MASTSLPPLSLFSIYLFTIIRRLILVEGAGVTVLHGIKASRLSVGDWVAVPGAGGGLGHLAVQYSIALGMRVVGIDTGDEKRKLVEGYGGTFIDFKQEKVRSLPSSLMFRLGLTARV